MNKKILILLFVLTAALGYFAFFWDGKQSIQEVDTNNPLYARFQVLASEGNSSCSSTFTDSISSMSDNSRIRGSCCSPMNWHRYKEQVEGLKKYKDIKEIPQDPYAVSYTHLTLPTTPYV